LGGGRQMVAVASGGALFVFGLPQGRAN